MGSFSNCCVSYRRGINISLSQARNGKGQNHKFYIETTPRMQVTFWLLHIWKLFEKVHQEHKRSVCSVLCAVLLYLLKLWAQLKNFNASSSVMGYLVLSMDSFYDKFLLEAIQLHRFWGTCSFSSVISFLCEKLHFLHLFLQCSTACEKAESPKKREKAMRKLRCQWSKLPHSNGPQHCFLWWEYIGCIWSQDEVSIWFPVLSVQTWLQLHYWHRSYPCLQSTKCLRDTKRQNWSPNEMKCYLQSNIITKYYWNVMIALALRVWL